MVRTPMETIVPAIVCGEGGYGRSLGIQPGWGIELETDFSPPISR